MYMLAYRTINGSAKKFRGHLRPNLFAMSPNSGIFITKVKLFRAGIQDACDCVIGPDSNVVVFDLSAGSAADAQPVIIPVDFYRSLHMMNIVMFTILCIFITLTILNANQ